MKSDGFYPVTCPPSHPMIEGEISPCGNPFDRGIVGKCSRNGFLRILREFFIFT
jgi:hypothetical protein